MNNFGVYSADGSPSRWTRRGDTVTKVRYNKLVEAQYAQSTKDLYLKRRTEMGELYNRFKAEKKQSEKNWFSEKMGLVKFECNEKNYEIFFTRKRANRYSIIHCKNNTVEWEQFPLLPRISGMYGKREPMISFAPSKENVRIVVITGKPNSITGLDEGVFRSVHKYDEKYINVMSEARFKEL